MGLFRRRTTPASPPPEPPASTAWKQLPVVSRLTGDLEPTIDTRFDQQLATWQSPAVTRLLDHGVRPDGPSGMVVRPPVRRAPAVFVPSEDVDPPAALSTAAEEPASVGSLPRSSRESGAETARSPDRNEGLPAIDVARARPVGLGPPLPRPTNPSPPALQRSSVIPATVVAPPSLALPIDGGTASALDGPAEPVRAPALTPVEAEAINAVMVSESDDAVITPPPEPVESVTTRATRVDAATVQATGPDNAASVELPRPDDAATIQLTRPDDAVTIQPTRPDDSVAADAPAPAVASTPPPLARLAGLGAPIQRAAPIQHTPAPAPLPTATPTPTPTPTPPATTEPPDVTVLHPIGAFPSPRPVMTAAPAAAAASSSSGAPVQRTAPTPESSDVTVLHPTRAFPSLRPVGAGAGSAVQRVSEPPATEPTVGLVASMPLIARFPSGAGAAVTAGVQRGASAVAGAVAAARAEPARIELARAVPPAVRAAPAAAALPSIGLLAAGGLSRAHSAPSQPSLVPWADAGAVAVAAGVAQRQLDGSVVFRTAGTDSPDEPTLAPAELATVERTEPTAVPGPTASAAPTTSAGLTPPATAPTADLDELARRLYGRLRVMLKHELRLDRERAGLLTASRR